MVAQAIASTTFCTGLWHLKKNSKKNFEQYLEILPKTLKMVAGGRVVAVSDSDMVLDAFDRAAKLWAIDIELRQRTVSELPYYAHTGEMLKSCVQMGGVNWLTLLRIRDRGRKIYRREWGIGGDDNYRAIVGIWISKIPLVMEYCIKDNPFTTTHSAWMDASVSRFNERRENWNFAEMTYGDSKFYHYGTKSWYKGRRMKINASFMLAENDVWPKVGALFEASLIESFREKYAHDDETILNRVVVAHSGLFESIGRFSHGQALAEQ